VFTHILRNECRFKMSFYILFILFLIMYGQEFIIVFNFVGYEGVNLVSHRLAI
jgi:hypothetical protein